MRWSRMMGRFGASKAVGHLRANASRTIEGFAEGSVPGPVPPTSGAVPASPATAGQSVTSSRAPIWPARPGAEEEKSDLPFPSTGPHGHRARMREKLLSRGPDALADYELLEMLLFFVIPKGDTKPLAKALINRFGSFADVLTAPQDDLLRMRGLGVHSVSAMKLVQAAAVRLARAQVLGQPVLSNWEALINYLNIAQGREHIEQFRVLFLDSRNRLLADEIEARGTVNHTPVYPREILKRALDLHATALILVHNHPSGDPTPSPQDIEMTREVQDGGRFLSVALHDHIIIGKGSWASFRQLGLL